MPSAESRGTPSRGAATSLNQCQTEENPAPRSPLKRQNQLHCCGSARAAGRLTAAHAPTVPAAVRSAGPASRRRSASTTTAPSTKKGKSLKAAPIPRATPPSTQRARRKASSASRVHSTGHRSQLMNAVTATAGARARSTAGAGRAARRAVVSTTPTHTAASSTALRSKYIP
ncbi:hypothetical protein AUQ48_03525 [Kocuria flava]|uniref:Uncharacterized protein n=1 Tax=Kocuria flava TaxID=446860 RepID=A0A2N4SZX0_9MICC|nr:hypothetical protein AUQ48_03525 [Kocuria flava]